MVAITYTRGELVINRHIPINTGTKMDSGL